MKMDRMTDASKRAYSATTRLLHADRLGGVEHGALHKPLHVSAAFNYPTARDLVEVFQGNQAGHVYARQGNPTVNALEAKVTLLEDAKGTATFATGMAAITAVFLALLRAGDHLVCTRFLFGNTNSLMQTLQALGVAVTFVDATAADNVRAAITPATRMVFVETIANPGTQVPDLQAIGAPAFLRRAKVASTRWSALATSAVQDSTPVPPFSVLEVTPKMN